MKKALSRIIAGMVALAISNTAMATDGIFCGGTVTLVALHSTDKLVFRLSGMNAQVMACSLGETLGASYPVSPQQCKAAYAMILMAAAQNKSMTAVFDNTATATNCSNFTSWETATLRYIYIQTP